MSFNLNQISAMSVQELVRDGSHHDLYYYDHANMFSQSRPTLCNNKFLQNFVSPNSGVNQLIFSPDQGLSDVIVVFKLLSESELTGGNSYANYGLNRGWGYNFINQVAVRYGGSSQYFFDGQQILMQNVQDMQDAVSRDVLFQLGGQACLGTNPATSANDFASNQYAYCYINLPHNTPNGDGLKMNPLPTELLRQPVLVQVQMGNVQQVFSANATANGAILPFAPVSDAYFQVKQVRMINSEDLLTSHHEPSKISYTLPLKYFPQQLYQLQIPVISSTPASSVTQTVNLTGFRNGGVRSILLWLSNTGNTPTTPVTATARVYNPNLWYAPENTVLSINGEIFYTSKYKSSLLLDLANNKQPNQLATTALTSTSGALTVVPAGNTSDYLKCDFSQVNDAVFGVNMLVAGKSITNSIVNFQFTTPQSQPNITTGWVLNALYLYNSSLVFAGGNCEYVF